VLGGLQIRALHQELVGSGKMTNRGRLQLRQPEIEQLGAAVDTFAFEIRSVRTVEDRIEVLRRQATRFYSNQQYDEANRLFDQLLSMHPNSYLGNMLKGDIARRRGLQVRRLRCIRKRSISSRLVTTSIPPSGIALMSK